ncbi:MAG: 50S ribosomal protein L11 [Candidatus Gracilibacteria bacterium]|nr:50S ribosomal protein L11 [Candidatus Gracilibacteria bacterium]
MAPKKNATGYISLIIEAGKANPAPPVGPALGQKGVNIQAFCTQFNDATKGNMGDLVPVKITVYEDKSFDFVVKVSPASFLIKKELGLKSGSKLPHKDKVAHLTFDQVKKLAEKKGPDLNAVDLAGAMKTIDGTARAMGITSDIHDLSLADLRKDPRLA